MVEKWKDFYFDEKLYSISSKGRVYGYLKEDYIVSRLDRDGYPAVTLGKNKSRRIVRIHRLVAKYFVKNKNPNKLNEVNHKDFNRKNNNYLNLEWCTHSENIQYSMDAGRMVFQTTNVSGENNPNFGNRKLSKIYSEDLEYAKEKQGRPGSRNGRCLPVRMIFENEDFCDFTFVRECSQYIIDSKISNNNKESISANIVKSMKNGSKYLGMSFVSLK